MQNDQHLTVPPSNSPPPQQSPPQNATFTGRPRSDSQRSQRSQHSTETPETDRRDFDRRPSIRIRRAPSNYQPPSDNGLLPTVTEGQHVGGRSRSNSAPQQLGTAGGGSQRRASYMPEVAEEITSPTTGNLQDGINSLPAADLNAMADVETGNQAPGRLNQASVSSWRPLRRARTNIGRAETQQEKDEREGAEYDAELIDILDLVGKRMLLQLALQLTCPHRSRSPGSTNFDERSELARCSISWEVFE